MLKKTSILQISEHWDICKYSSWESLQCFKYSLTLSFIVQQPHKQILVLSRSQLLKLLKLLPWFNSFHVFYFHNHLLFAPSQFLICWVEIEKKFHVYKLFVFCLIPAAISLFLTSPLLFLPAVSGNPSHNRPCWSRHKSPLYSISYLKMLEWWPWWIPHVKNKEFLCCTSVNGILTFNLIGRVEGECGKTWGTNMSKLNIQAWIQEFNFQERHYHYVHGDKSDILSVLK